MTKLIFYIFLFFTITVYSQQDSVRGNYWINSSIPPFPEFNSLTLNYSFNFSIKNLSLNTMVFYAEGENSSKQTDFHKVELFSISTGYRITHKYYMLATFLGPGYTRLYNSNYSPKVLKTVSLVSNIQLYVYPLPDIGITGLGLGCELVSIFNTSRNYNFVHLAINYLF